METARHKTATRSVSPQPKPAAAPQIQRRATSGAAKVQCQSAMKVSSPQDTAEKEADRTAQKIMRMAVPESSISYVRTEKGGVFRQVKPEEREKDKKIQRSLQSPYIQRFANTGIFTQRNLDDRIQRKAEGQPNVASNVAAEIQASTATGAPLPLTVRRFMEPRFQANFSPVKIHTGDRSAKLNRQLNAQAFTVGNQIFFGKDKFKPDSQEGKELIAHELTHTIQQGAAIQRREAVSVTPVSVTQQAPVQVQRLGLSDALDYFADKANLIPGFRMFTIILGVNPINMSRVERSAANILRAIVEFIPGGGLITRALDNYGVFEKVGAWIEQQITTLGLVGSAFKQAISDFLDSLSWTDIFDLGGVWNRAKRIFTDPIDRIISFGRNLVTGIIRFVKEAILRPLARLAEGTRGYDLLKAVLGQDPITGDPVPRNADTLIGGFMKLIGQEEVWNNLKRANAVARAWAWFQGALAGLLGFVRQIPTLFIQALQSLEIADIVLLPRAFVRVGTVFANFVGQFISWAGQQVMSLLQIIFEVVAPGAMPYIRRAAGAFRSIIQNPIGFVRNLVRAGIQGFRQFATNFLTHLRTSLIGWLTGTMSGANIYIPQAFTLREIIKFVLSVLGLTWQNIRQKLVRVIGEPAVQALETGFDIVMTLVTQGPAAAWEKIQESLSNLRDMVMEQIMTFVRDRVVQAAITRLITSLNPAGAFIQAIIATYNTIMFFVERLRQIAQVAMAFIDSVSAIASGVLTAAANRVETTMAGLLTLVISFLARIAGLGRVSDAVTNIINRVRAPIDRALDRVVDWIVAQARRLGRLAQRGATALITGTLRALRAPRRVSIPSVPEAVLEEVQRTQAGTVLYSTPGRSGSSGLQSLVQAYPSARFENTSGTLTLPPVDGGALVGSSLRAISSALGRATGVSRITLSKSRTGWGLDVHINPTFEGLASYTLQGDRLDPLRRYLQQRINRVQPNRDVLLAILRAAATRYNCLFETEDIRNRAVVQTVVSFTERTPPAGERAQFYQEVIVPTAPPTFDCASCRRPPTGGEIRTAPHNVIPQHVWRSVIMDLFTRFGVPSVTPADREHRARILASGTGTGFGPALTPSGQPSRAAATTSGVPATEEYDRQCRVCETMQDRPLPGPPRPGGPATLVQRAQARAQRERVGSVSVPVPGAPSGSIRMRGTVNYLGRQFGNLTQNELQELIQGKITDVSNRARAAVTNLPATSAVRAVLFPQLENFLAALRTDATAMAQQVVPPGGFPR